MKRENYIAKREKMTKIHKINLIYASKLKYNVTRQKIRKKTYYLTQNCTRNDPLYHRIKAFHSTFQKFKNTAANSSLSLYEILISNTPLTQKLVYKRTKARYLRTKMSKRFD